jgi:molybdopterin molybdotransferase
MISFEEAFAKTMKHASNPERENIALRDAFGRFLCESITSPMDSPPFDKSSMDGYAIKKNDSSKGYRVLEIIAAGDVPGKSIEDGSCSKIMTGAMVPKGADKVIRVEFASETDGVMSVTTPEPYDNIIFRGENIKTGDTLVKPQRLTAKDIGCLAASGISTLEVYRPLKVGIITTGSELKEPGEQIDHGEIYNSNGYQLECQVNESGCVALRYGTIEDTPTSHKAAITKAESECDVVILTGGVSKGDYDYVPPTLVSLGFDIIYHGVRVKPGRPTLFAKSGNAFVFGLPGNPVSTFMLYEMIVKPFIFACYGVEAKKHGFYGTLRSTLNRKDNERVEFRPVITTKESESIVIDPITYHGSSHMNALGDADGIIRIEAGQSTIEEGKLIYVGLI